MERLDNTESDFHFFLFSLFPKVTFQIFIYLFSEIFVGQLKSELKFDDCGHRSVTFDPFWDLSLPIPKVRYHILVYHFKEFVHLKL